MCLNFEKQHKNQSKETLPVALLVLIRLKGYWRRWCWCLEIHCVEFITKIKDISRHFSLYFGMIQFVSRWKFGIYDGTFSLVDLIIVTCISFQRVFSLFLKVVKLKLIILHEIDCKMLDYVLTRLTEILEFCGMLFEWNFVVTVARCWR